MSFLELSHLSFVGDLGGKGKEGLVQKRTGSGAKAGCNFLGLLEGMLKNHKNFIPEDFSNMFVNFRNVLREM